MSRRQVQILWAFIVLVALAGGASTFAVASTVHEQDARERQARQLDEQRQHDFCALVKIFIAPSEPPTAGRGLDIEQALEAYLRRNC